ncbi:hypothetical protein CR513_49749, partial [Mucuna pruriens]
MAWIPPRCMIRNEKSPYLDNHKDRLRRTIMTSKVIHICLKRGYTTNNDYDRDNKHLYKYCACIDRRAPTCETEWRIKLL